MRRLAQGLAFGWGLSAGVALAEDAVFDVSLAGVRVAEMTVASKIAGDRYGVSVLIRSDGLAGVVRRIRFDARAEGRITGRPGSGFAPARYSEQADTGRRQSQVEMVYDRGVPQVVTYSSLRADGPDLLDPMAQEGTLDPATALFAGLQDRAAGQACAVSFEVFDGRRRSAFALSGEGMTCNGDYRRIAGYTAEEMAERVRFALEVTFAPHADAVRVVEATVQTVYGKVRLKRR